MSARALFVLALCLSTLLGSAPPAHALMSSDVHAIAALVLERNNPDLVDAYQALLAGGILDPDDQPGDPAREIAFRVLNSESPGVQDAYRTIKSNKVFEALVSVEPPNEEPAEARGVRDELGQMKDMHELATAIHREIEMASIFQYPRLRRRLLAAINKATSLYDRAKDAFAVLPEPSHPGIPALKTELDEASEKVQEWINFYNRVYNRR